MEEISATSIRILLFAALRDQAGWGERQWPTAPCSGAAPTPRQLWKELDMPGKLSGIRVAINQQFSDADTPLKAGDELAFLPPISGG
ncbi:MoaD/ThiS family protein [Cyanobium sp. HWJ4-Hawea]|uniref:MoaD/ThiS family protein n=1 Tax=unclassified Cyanobium TaxID=2627006 RepID=UPI0020CF8B25|nr:MULTISPECIES: MoaD/ThiS family protein [unclassified Cyanobium]MCP9775512.1 MoaD/ThiS family protein [Cyanobium sp. WAJ14-Wanaka]MCP9809011.1 MoaD/ThiS family protein [Cyanobium sp. HWJ4-Hawea]